MTFTANGHTYRLLGASGLVEDEDGEIYNASDLSDPYSQPKEPTPSKSAFTDFGVSSVLNDKTNPAYWYYDYDPRYCGPSREEYMEKMAMIYRKQAARFADDEPQTAQQPQTVQQPQTTQKPKAVQKPQKQHDRAVRHKPLTVVGPAIDKSSPRQQEPEATATSSKETVTQPRQQVYISKKVIAFTIIGGLLLITYFVLLINKLIHEIASLF